MADEQNTSVVVEDEEQTTINQSYMNRLFCSTKERITFVLLNCVSGMRLGDYELGSDIFLYKIFGITSPTRYAKASLWLKTYDIINDPLTAVIVDNMRTRWGKFKPFQYLYFLPGLITGFINCILPMLSLAFGWQDTQRIYAMIALNFCSETLGALIGSGGGYLGTVFTPNPDERTSLVLAAQFVDDLISKLPQQIMQICMDFVFKNEYTARVVKFYVLFRTTLYFIMQIPAVAWVFVSKERVPQSEKLPTPLHSLKAVFTNKPLLIYTLSGLVDGIDIGTNQSLYYTDVVKFNLMKTIGGIPGAPISYASYPIATKFRKKFSTKALWLMCRGSVFISEGFFFLMGMIGGRKNGLYKKKIPMTIVFALGNCFEMVFFASRKLVGQEISFEVLDYCEWKNGYRVEATITLVQGYFEKIKSALLSLVNAWLLEKWAGFEGGLGKIQNDETKWKMFLTAFGPHLIFDAISMVPMFFYNIDKKTRDKMYLELEIARSQRSNIEDNS